MVVAHFDDAWRRSGGKAGIGIQTPIVGTRTITFPLRLVNPTPTDLTRLANFGPTLSQQLGLPFSIRRTPTGFLLELQRAHHDPIAPDVLREHTRGIKQVCVGIDSLNRPVTISLPEVPTFMAVGTPGSGKTQAIRSMLYALCSRDESVRYVIFSHKVGEDWFDFADAISCLGIVSDGEEAMQVLTWAKDESIRRAKEGTKPYTVVLLIDDLPLWLGEVGKDMAQLLKSIATFGRSSQIFLWMLTQFAGSQESTGGTLVEAQVKARLCYKATNNTASSRASGRTKDEVDLTTLSGKPGDAMLISDRGIHRLSTGHSKLAPCELGHMLYRNPGGNGTPPWTLSSQDCLSTDSQVGVSNKPIFWEQTPLDADCLQTDSRQTEVTSSVTSLDDVTHLAGTKLPITPARQLTESEAAALRDLDSLKYTNTDWARRVFVVNKTPAGRHLKYIETARG